jgi:hypothetical protein
MVWSCRRRPSEIGLTHAVYHQGDARYVHPRATDLTLGVFVGVHGRVLQVFNMASRAWIAVDSAKQEFVVVVVVVVMLFYLWKVRILEKLGFESMKWTESKAKACQNLSNLTNLTQR